MKNTWLFCKLKTLMTLSRAVPIGRISNMYWELSTSWTTAGQLNWFSIVLKRMRDLQQFAVRPQPTTCHAQHDSSALQMPESVTCTKPQRTSTSLGLFKTCKHIPQRSRTRQDEAGRDRTKLNENWNILQSNRKWYIVIYATMSNMQHFVAQAKRQKAASMQEAGVLHINQKWNTKLDSTKLLSLAQKLNHSPIKISQVTGNNWGTGRKSDMETDRQLDGQSWQAAVAALRAIKNCTCQIEIETRQRERGESRQKFSISLNVGTLHSVECTAKSKRETENERQKS